MANGLQAALIAAAGIAVAGVADYLLTTSGHVGLGRLTWAIGFGTTVLAVWYVWLRPMDLSGPDG